MRLASCLIGGAARAAVVSGDRLHVLDASMADLIGLDRDALDRLADTALRAPGAPIGEVALLPPLTPPSIRDFVAFEEHVEGVARSVSGATGDSAVPDAWYDAPTFYFTNPGTLLGDGADVPFPAASAARDFELEVAVVVGREGANLTVEQARDHVFGYAILADWSARDLQRREMQVTLGPAKGKDFATSLGPWIVTADELDDRRDGEGFLDLWCSVDVNGVEVGRDLLSNMGWTFEAMIAYASRDSRVAPGDVLGSGTVGNGGCLGELWGRRGRQDPPPLRDGDIVTMSVERLGSLSGRVASGPPAAPLPPPRRRDHAAARASLPRIRTSD